MVKKIISTEELGEKIANLCEKNGIEINKLISLVEKFDTSLSKDTADKFLGGKYKSEMGYRKIIAFSQIFNIKIDDLLDNHVENDDNTFIVKKETNLSSESIEKLKNKKTEEYRTFIEILNYLICSDFFDDISYKINKYMKDAKSIQKAKDINVFFQTNFQTDIDFSITELEKEKREQKKNLMKALKVIVENKVEKMIDEMEENL